MPESYLEKCIAQLPPEKQAAAREAFRAIAENGDDNLISKLLVVLEANSAYAASIPKAIVYAGETIVRNMDERVAKSAQQQAEQEALRDERLRQLITAQVPQLGKQMSLNKVVAGLAAQTAELGRIQRQLVRLRHARVGGLLLVLLLGAAVGAGGVVGSFWRSYHAAQLSGRFVQNLNAVGVYAKISPAESGVCLTIESARALRGNSWRKDAQGHIVGADFFLPIGGGR